MKDKTWEARMQMTPYEGKGDYIFVSYSHRDMDIVFPILWHLHEKGVRFWYDEGIDPGAEWPEAIAKHLDGCRGCLAFVSPNSKESPNCRREVNFALSKNKEFLSVVLSPVEMSLGMEMQMASYQSIIKYRYPKEEQFLNKLMSVELITNCQRETSESGGEETPAQKPSWKPLVLGGGILAVLLILALVTYSLPSKQPAAHVLMSDNIYGLIADPEDSGLCLVFGSRYPRNQIRTITFLNTLKGLPDDAWDVSEEGDGTVMAWVKPNGKLLDLYIGADGGVTAPADCMNLFAFYDSMRSIDLNGIFDTANVTNMCAMFRGCSSLETLDVSGFDTANVTNMSYMFWGCGSLETLDVSGFDTAGVTNMRAMFSDCGSLETLDVSGFNTADVTDMAYMFNMCSGMTTLDVSGFNTANVTDIGCMFFRCSSLGELDVSGFDTANVENMNSAFRDCSSIKTLDVSGFNTENVTDMAAMFCECQNIKTLNVSGFDTFNVTNMFAMFADCDNIKTLDVSGFDTENVTDMSYMFKSCSGIRKLDLSGFDTDNVVNMDYMFYGCEKLTLLQVSNWNVSDTSTEYIFDGCSLDPEVVSAILSGETVSI